MAGALSSLLIAPGGIFNVGSGHGMSVKQLAQKVLLFAGQATREIISQQTTPHDSQLVLNTQKIKQTTGWEMSQDTDSQLKQFICQEQST
jgi:UDP-glucose 4-epimerase